MEQGNRKQGNREISIWEKIAENISIKENHKKEIIKMVVENKLEKSGLKLPANTIKILENCNTPTEIENQLRIIRDNLREGIVNTVSGNINEIKVESINTKTPIQVKIDSHVENIMKSFGV